MWRRTIWLIGALLAGCGGGQPSPSAQPQPVPGAIRFLALGDSYSIGEGVDPQDTWPSQLATALTKAGTNVGPPQIIATTGWTTADLSAAMDDADLKGPYDLVGLLIGVNNQYQGRSEAEYAQQFGDLLKRAIHLAGDRPGRVIVLSIPDWGVTPFAKQTNADSAAVAAAIDRFNAINKSLTAKAGAGYVDITPLTRRLHDQVVDDGLHPAKEQYAQWVQLALPAAQSALRN